jgi:hypothetical protein
MWVILSSRAFADKTNDLFIWNESYAVGFTSVWSQNLDIGLLNNDVLRKFSGGETINASVNWNSDDSGYAAYFYASAAVNRPSSLSAPSASPPAANAGKRLNHLVISPKLGRSPSLFPT